ncbi:uncharacterized protein [Musca autumnalis]|uniref:uncharacterized protein n=1 Tax=Musca autumnalis TaxID=221902 RepID=UPI003CF203D5
MYSCIISYLFGTILMTILQNLECTNTSYMAADQANQFFLTNLRRLYVCNAVSHDYRIKRIKIKSEIKEREVMENSSGFKRCGSGTCVSARGTLRFLVFRQSEYYDVKCSAVEHYDF